MEEGKKRSQIKDSETFAFIAMLGIVIMLLIMILSSCNNIKAQENEEMAYIVIDGQKVEMVIDKGENLYLKYKIGETDVFIPFPFETQDEETDSLHFYNVKNK